MTISKLRQLKKKKESKGMTSKITQSEITEYMDIPKKPPIDLSFAGNQRESSY